MFNRFACRLFLLRINSRQYAKKAAHNKSSSSSSSNNGASELQEFDFSKFSDRMDHCVDKFRQELSQLRLGRANTSLLENIRVQLPSKSADKNHHKHQNVKLSQLAQLIVKDPQTVHVVVADEQVRVIMCVHDSYYLLIDCDSNRQEHFRR